MSKRDEERRAKLLQLLIDYDARDPDVLLAKIEALYGKRP